MFKLEAEFVSMDLHGHGGKLEADVNTEPAEEEDSDEFLLPAFEFETTGLPSSYIDCYPNAANASVPATVTTTATAPAHYQRHLPLPFSTELTRYPIPASTLYSIFNRHIPPFLDNRRPQMPRAPHIELHGTQRLSPANPTSMAVETRHATVTSPNRPQWDPHPSIKIEDTKSASKFSKFETSGGAFKPLHRHRHQQQSSPSPPPTPKTVSVTVIQPSTSSYTGASRTSAISGTVTSSTESYRITSRSPVVSERISTRREAGYLPSQYPPYAVDPTFSLHVAVEVHRATQQDTDGDTPLHIAISQADELEMSLIRHLISLVAMSGRSVDIFNYIQQTPLHIAVITDHAIITRLLLEAAANPNETDRNGLTAIHHACVNNSIVCLKTILDRSKFTVDMNARNYNGFAPLHATVMDNNMEMTDALLLSGASVEVQDAKNGWSPLFHAVINQNQTMITRLIEAGAKVNAQSYSGNTALHVATGRGYTDVVRLLMRYGADMSVKNTHRDTPVMVSSNRMISSILQGRGPSASQGRRPAESTVPYHSEACLRVPTRPHAMASSQHPLSLAESLHPHRLPPASAPKPGPHTPLPLVKHLRQSPPKRRSHASHSPICPSPLTSKSGGEQSENASSPKKLIIDETLSTSSASGSPNHLKSEESTASSCRVSVIVQRQPLFKDNLSSRMTPSPSDEKKPSERMPLVSRMLRDTGVVNNEAVLEKFSLKPLPSSEPSPSSECETRSEELPAGQMPILEPVSPMEAKHSDTADTSKAPHLSSSHEGPSSMLENKDVSHESSTSSEPPLSPAIEMSDDEDEPMATPPASPKSGSSGQTETKDNRVPSPAASPKRSHEAALSESSDESEAKDSSEASDEEQSSKRLRKDSIDNVHSLSS